MTRFVMRKNIRFKRLVAMQYMGDEFSGAGMIKDLSLSGSYIAAYTPVSVGMALALKLFVPGDLEPLLIDRAIVKWVKGSEFGVDFGTPQRPVAERIMTIISRLVKTEYGAPTMDKKAGRCTAPPNFWTGRLRQRCALDGSRLGCP